MGFILAAFTSAARCCLRFEMWAFLGTPRTALASTCFVYSVPLLFCYLLGWVDYRRILYPVLLKFEEARKDSPVFACGTVVR